MRVITLILFAVITVNAQPLPRWPSDAQVRVYVKGEQVEVEAAVKAWQPYLPPGLQLEYAGVTQHVQDCKGCVTVVRERTQGSKDERGDCTLYAHEGLTDYAVIKIDPRAKGEQARNVLEHELGHMLGLGHYKDSVMQRKVSSKRPSERDARVLRVLYSELRFSVNSLVQPVLDAPPAPLSKVVVEQAVREATFEEGVQRYSFKRLVIRGDEWRKSTFIWDNRNKLVEINVEGSQSRMLRQAPHFPVGRDADWLQQGCTVTGTSGQAVIKDRAGDKGLLFAVEAMCGDIHIKLYDYALFRSEVAIKEVN